MNIAILNKAYKILIKVIIISVVGFILIFLLSREYYQFFLAPQKSLTGFLDDVWIIYITSLIFFSSMFLYTTIMLFIAIKRKSPLLIKGYLFSGIYLIVVVVFWLHYYF